MFLQLNFPNCNAEIAALAFFSISLVRAILIVFFGFELDSHIVNKTFRPLKASRKLFKVRIKSNQHAGPRYGMTEITLFTNGKHTHIGVLSDWMFSVKLYTENCEELIEKRKKKTIQTICTESLTANKIRRHMVIIISKYLYKTQYVFVCLHMFPSSQFDSMKNIIHAFFVYMRVDTWTKFEKECASHIAHVCLQKIMIFTIQAIKHMKLIAC